MAKILKISPDSAARYLQMFLENFLVYSIPRCGKTNERILSPKKIYCVDRGIRVLFTGFRDKGSLFENYVYLKLKDRNPCYVYKDGIEIDFLTEDGLLVEAKYGGQLTARQNELFEQIKAKNKAVVAGIRTLEALLE
jgi:predicted AAA+ superfamily ATPase